MDMEANRHFSPTPFVGILSAERRATLRDQP
jgi:hypothetical protein